ncbi:MAG: hypothetical protein WCQ23_07485 [Candidatus Methanomethylophilaceae archaeon]
MFAKFRKTLTSFARKWRKKPSSGKIYGGNINRVASVLKPFRQGKAYDPIPLSNKISMINEDHTSIVELVGKDEPPMGVDAGMDGRQYRGGVRLDSISKIKLPDDEEFDVSIEYDGKEPIFYTLKNDRGFYKFKIDNNGISEAAPVNYDSKNSVCFKTDTNEIKDVINANGKTSGKNDMDYVIRTKNDGVVLGPKGEPGKRKTISKGRYDNGTTAIYTGKLLNNVTPVDDEIDVEFGQDSLIAFKWDGANFKGKILVAPKLSDEPLNDDD